ncbi:MAG: tetratricopeptide repeat protein [Bacteroidota bacterium]
MKKIHCSCWLILFLLTALWSSAQTPKIDSLKKELIRNSVSDRYDVLWGLAYELFDVDNLQATGYAKEAHQAALASGDTLDIVMSGRILGQLFRRVDKVDESIDVLNFVLPISKGWKLNGEIKKILTALAVSYAFKGEFDKALEANLECLIIRQVENNNKEVSISFNNLGVLFSSLEDYSLSLNYYLKSLDLKMELADEDKVDMDLLLVNIALDYMEINDYANADLYFDKAVKYCSPLCRPTIVIRWNLA